MRSPMEMYIKATKEADQGLTDMEHYMVSVTHNHLHLLVVA